VEDDWSVIVEGLRSGDAQTVRAFCRTYGGSLERLAASHMASMLKQRVGAEDVVQSVYRTFLRRVGADELVLDDVGELWRLLCAITLTKVREQARYHLRKRRRLDREQALDAPEDAGAATAPTPEEQGEFVQLFEALIDGLDDEEKQIVMLKLDGCTNLEIANQVKSSERTIRRLMVSLRGRLERLLRT
jgi:RNA polymerase sigma factor (sigma-70 family)